MAYDKQNEAYRLADDVNALLFSIRSIRANDIARKPNNLGHDWTVVIQSLVEHLNAKDRSREADALIQAVDRITESKSHGGLGISPSDDLDWNTRRAILFQFEVFLEALNSEDNAFDLLTPLPERLPGRRPMTLSQKILAHHSVGTIHSEGLAVGELVRTSIDWVISSELSWEMLRALMEKSGTETIFRNDRLWLAGDHRVDPKNYETAISKDMIKAMERAEKSLKLTNFKGSNYTIIHTEFVREQAEPGSLIIGADSHTCSSGAMGCLAIGLGAEDVVVPLMTGETWFKVPECISIVFTGQPLPGIGGKDVILYILRELKRNTVAANRIVEFSGPGIKHLSVDARFAISNMCTEFGAVTGIFVPDEATRSYLGSRRSRRRNDSAMYFKPDDDAIYSETFTIDLSEVKPSIALYPSPDNVVSVTERVGMKLDGCFIGACTTAEEDLVLAALVLKVGLNQGLKTVRGIRHVTPGSLPIVERLGELGLLEVFEQAGFTRGAPGCSYCVGISDTAPEGSTWLTSQNRNFPNRMGKGSFANLAAAITVAASSFSMSVTDPSPFLKKLDSDIWARYREMVKMKKNSKNGWVGSSTPLSYVEPNYKHRAQETPTSSTEGKKADVKTREPIRSKIVTLGDFIDTDALAPSEFLLEAVTNAQLGEHCLQYTVPDFRDKVKAGQKVVVAGKAFGVGSSRENAPRALKGLGVQCVIARSFAFIYARNQPNLGLLGIVIEDESFHTAASEGRDIEIDLNIRQCRIGGQSWGFQLDDMELALVENGGMTASYKRFGKEVFERLTTGNAGRENKVQTGDETPEALRELQW